MNHLQLSIVVPTLHGTEKLHSALHSILQQQTAPSFEVLIVSNFPHAELEMNLQRWDRRFKYFCSGEFGVNKARNLGLENARGEIVLFLDDDMWIDDKLFLKKHYDTHQRFPTAIGVGGPYALKRNANVFETAYHWLLNSNLQKASIDRLRCSELAGGNSSFKTIALRSAFAFDNEIDLGGSSADLHARLVAAGQELVFNEKLVIEHRPKIGFIEFIRRAYLIGRSEKVRELKQIVPAWHFKGGNMTRERFVQEHSGILNPGVRLAFWLFDFVRMAAHSDVTQPKYTRHVSTAQIFKSILRESKQRLKQLPHTSAANELFLSLRFSIFGR